MLFICNTPYQIIVSAKIVNSFYPKSRSVIIITDYISNAETLYEQISDNNIFAKGYLLKIKKYKWQNRKNLIPAILKKQIRKVLNYAGVNDNDLITDEIFIANTGDFTLAFAKFLLWEKYSDKVSYFEDGIASYSEFIHKRFDSHINPTNMFKKIYYKIIGQFLQI